MTWATTVPAALEGLVAALRAAPGLEGVDVYDGPVVSESKATAAISVGFTGERMSQTGAYPETTEAAVEVSSAPASLAGPADQAEQYTVQNMLAVLDGSRDVTAARTRAYKLLAAAGQAVTGDKTLGGAVAMARPGDHSLTQEQGQRGALVTIMFEVTVSAWTSRPPGGGLGRPARGR